MWCIAGERGGGLCLCLCGYNERRGGGVWRGLELLAGEWEWGGNLKQLRSSL